MKAAIAALALATLAAPGALAANQGGNSHASPPLHGPGSSHNPIVYHPVHGPGSSHNPIVRHCRPLGTVVHDHRNGKNCSYIVGDRQSYLQYRQCEGIRGGGGARGASC
jgi:hypothetical protein